MKYARLYDNRLSAIAVEGKSAVAASRIELTHGVIDQTRGSPIFPNVGSGASIENGAHASLTDVRVSRSLMVGVQVIKSSSRLVARRLLVDETQPTLAGQGGHGLTVDTGASATVVDARFSANHQACVAVMRPGSKLDALGLHVDGTKLGPKANGIALGVLWGATATVQGSRFVGNIGAGIYSHGVDGTVLRLRGSRVENTLPGTGGGAAGGGGTLESAEGNGLTAWRPAQTVEVSSCLFRGNHGVSVYLDEASGSVKGCAIVDTKPSTFLNSGADARGRRGEGPEIKLADGILARNVGDVHISHTLVVDQLRAGILLVEKGKVAVTNSMAARGQFGLVMQSGVKTTLERNVFFENSSNIDGSGALFVPPPPTLPVM